MKHTLYSFLKRIKIQLLPREDKASVQLQKCEILILVG